jgi:LmbE family N-acetylglucosaminyl deacetylase
VFEKTFGERVLVIAPHADDEVIGCGGTLLHFRDKIQHLAIAHLTSSPERAGEFKRVATALGINAHHALGHEDGFCGDAIRSLTLEVVSIIQEERPDVVLVPHRHDGHADHEAASRVVWDATHKARYWPTTGTRTVHRVPTILEYEVWTPLRRPAVVYDISDVFAKKLDLVAFYESQTQSFPYVNFVTALNGWRGALHRRGGHAEAFGCYSI